MQSCVLALTRPACHGSHAGAQCHPVSETDSCILVKGIWQPSLLNMAPGVRQVPPVAILHREGDWHGVLLDHSWHRPLPGTAPALATC